MTPELWCARLGLVPYEEARALQKRLEAARQGNEVPDLLLLLEHPPVYTKGRRADPSELGMGEDWYRMQGIEVTDADRGGRVTYHGPGQLVGYPIVSLRPYGDDVAGYVRRMERVMVESLADLGIPAGVIEGVTGVWAGPSHLLSKGGDDELAPRIAGGEIRKIGSIGVHVNRGVTTHGFAINVNNDLQPFEWIVPCGIEGCRMTSVCRELGSEHDMAEVMDIVTERFASVYGRAPAEVPAGRIAAAGAEAPVA
jgi:lipoyl(octanoyl) transferase